MSLPFDALLGLGPHHMSATLKLSEEGPKRGFESVEIYDLKWEGWRRYAYRIVKEEHPTFDVIVVGDKAYQIMFDGRARPRENVHDFHYYLQQTWNVWAVAARPFGDALLFSPTQTQAREDRPATRYQVELDPNKHIISDAGGTGTMRTELLSAEGDLWVDDTTGAPISVNFRGSYKTVRVSRVPGRPDAETEHTITLQLERTGFGQEQSIEVPELMAPRVAPPSAAPATASSPKPKTKTTRNKQR